MSGPHRAVAALAIVAVSCLGAAAGSARAELQPIDPAPFSLNDLGSSRAGTTQVRRLRRRTAGAATRGVIRVAKLQARAVAGSPGTQPVGALAGGFRWTPEDESTTAWYPQGITGSWDASSSGRWRGQQVLLVSWYSTLQGDANEGARITFVNVGRGGTPTYRHVLLVEPVARGRYGTIQPIRQLHAGGIAWYGRWLYVADTFGGLRVFDVQRMLRMGSRAPRVGCGRRACHAAGHRFVLPQVAFYRQPPAAGLRFSFVSVDRTTTPHSLLAGEYRKGKPGGRLVRWRLDPATGRPLTNPDGTAPAWEAFATSVTNVQGAVSVAGRFLLSTSRGTGTPGRLYATTVGGRDIAHPWGIGPEDLTYSPQAGYVFGLTEHPGRRAVFAVSQASL